MVIEDACLPGFLAIEKHRKINHFIFQTDTAFYDNLQLREKGTSAWVMIKLNYICEINCNSKCHLNRNDNYTELNDR